MDIAFSRLFSLSAFPEIIYIIHIGGGARTVVCHMRCRTIATPTMFVSGHATKTECEKYIWIFIELRLRSSAVVIDETWMRPNRNQWMQSNRDQSHAGKLWSKWMATSWHRPSIHRQNDIISQLVTYWGRSKRDHHKNSIVKNWKQALKISSSEQIDSQTILFLVLKHVKQSNSDWRHTNTLQFELEKQNGI